MNGRDVDDVICEKLQVVQVTEPMLENREITEDSFRFIHSAGLSQPQTNKHSMFALIVKPKQSRYPF